MTLADLGIVHEPRDDGGYIEFTVDMLPPSYNRVGMRGTHWDTGREKKRWNGLLEQQLQLSGMPLGCVKVKANCLLIVYDGRDRDEGNFRLMVEKALGDALTGSSHTYRMPVPGETTPTGKQKMQVFKVYPDGRWLVDDKEHQFRFPSLRVSKRPLPPPPNGYGPGLTRAMWRQMCPQGRTKVRLRYWT